MSLQSIYPSSFILNSRLTTLSEMCCAQIAMPQLIEQDINLDDLALMILLVFVMKALDFVYF